MAIKTMTDEELQTEFHKYSAICNQLREEIASRQRALRTITMNSTVSLSVAFRKVAEYLRQCNARYPAEGNFFKAEGANITRDTVEYLFSGIHIFTRDSDLPEVYDFQHIDVDKVYEIEFATERLMAEILS